MGNLFEELKRRNVVRVGIAYAVVGWFVMQIADTMAPVLKLPDWTTTLIAFLLVLGLPVALFCSWAFELTPEGVKKTEEVDKSESLNHSTGRKLDRVIIVGLVVALGYFVWERQQLVEQAEQLEERQVAEVASTESRVTIAVLAFADMSAAGDQEYFGDGIAEEIINRLASVDALKVTSRTSAFSFKESNLSIPEIAAELGARYVVEGSVRSAGNQLRVTAQLIEVASDSHLWSETYDRQMDDIFVIQDDISRSITESLEVQLVGAATPDRPTENLEAYRLYLQGHHLYLQSGALNIEKAIKRFEEAVALDPEFAEAWAGLAASSAILPAYSIHYDPETAMVRAGEAADRALAIDPDLAQAWVVQGNILSWNSNWAKARVALERAVELDPDNDIGWYYLSLSYLFTGFLADAQAMAERAVEIAPQSGANNGALGRIHLAQGNLDMARKASEDAIALGWPFAHGDLALLAARAGDGERIAEGAGKFISTIGNVYDEKLTIYAQAYVDPTGREAARTLLKADTEQGRGFQNIWGGLLLLDGESFVRSLEATSNATFWMVSMLWDAPFRPMLKQQAVKDFFVRRGLVDYWRENGWPDFCRPLGADDFECD